MRIRMALTSIGRDVAGFSKDGKVIEGDPHMEFGIVDVSATWDDLSAALRERTIFGLVPNATEGPTMFVTDRDIAILGLPPGNYAIVPVSK